MRKQFNIFVIFAIMSSTLGLANDQEIFQNDQSQMTQSQQNIQQWQSQESVSGNGPEYLRTVTVSLDDLGTSGEAVRLLSDFWSKNEMLLNVFKLEQMGSYLKQQPQFDLSGTYPMVTYFATGIPLIGDITAKLSIRKSKHSCSGKVRDGYQMVINAEQSDEMVTNEIKDFIVNLCLSISGAGTVQVNADVYTERGPSPGILGTFVLNMMSGRIETAVQRIHSNLRDFRSGVLQPVN